MIGVLAAGGAQLGETGPAGEGAFRAGDVHLRNVVGHADVEGRRRRGREGRVVVEGAGERARADPAGLEVGRTARPGRGAHDHVRASDRLLGGGCGVRTVFLREAPSGLATRRPGSDGPKPRQGVPERLQRRRADAARTEDGGHLGPGSRQPPGGDRRHRPGPQRGDPVRVQHRSRGAGSRVVQHDEAGGGREPERAVLRERGDPLHAERVAHPRRHGVQHRAGAR